MEFKDDFAVLSVVSEKHDSVQAKAHDPLKEGDRAFMLASEKINRTMGTVGDGVKVEWPEGETIDQNTDDRLNF